MNASEYSSMVGGFPTSKCVGCGHINVNIRRMNEGDVEMVLCSGCGQRYVKFVAKSNEELQNMSGYRFWAIRNLRRNTGAEPR